MKTVTVEILKLVWIIHIISGGSARYTEVIIRLKINIDIKYTFKCKDLTVNTFSKGVKCQSR